MNTEILFDNRSGKDIDDTTFRKIEKAVIQTLKNEGIDTDCEVSISVVDKDEIRELNSMYRNIDKVTDVLSFPMDEMIVEGETLILGDVVLCMDRAEEQAEEYGHSFDRELCYLTVHSVLHLIGYDHMTEREKQEMREHEEQVMTDLNLSRRC